MGSISNLSVIVVGGGIGGLSAAIALRRAGHSVTVFEKSSFASEVGAAVTLSPNITRILKSWDLHWTAMHAVKWAGYSVKTGTDLKDVLPPDTTDYVKLYGSEYVTVHRGDFHSALLDIATRSTGQGIPVDVRNSKPVAEYDCEAGVVSFADGTVEKGDLIVAADGVHSRAASHIMRYDCPAYASDDSVIRFLVPTQVLLDDPATAPMMEHGDGYCVFYLSPDKLRWLLRYPCRENKLQNFAMYIRKPPTEEEKLGWSLKCDNETLRQAMEGFHPMLLKLCEKTDDILPLWRCTERQPLPECYRGQMVMIGDASHPMLPHRGQGACSAIEDAAALGRLFEGYVSPDTETVQNKLEIFKRTRQNRVAAIQLYSHIYMYQDCVEVQKEECLRYLPEEDLPKDIKAMQAWLYGYDVVKSVETALMKNKNQEGTSSI